MCHRCSHPRLPCHRRRPSQHQAHDDSQDPHSRRDGSRSDWRNLAGSRQTPTRRSPGKRQKRRVRTAIRPSTYMGRKQPHHRRTGFSDARRKTRRAHLLCRWRRPLLGPHAGPGQAQLGRDRRPGRRNRRHQLPVQRRGSQPTRDIAERLRHRNVTGLYPGRRKGFPVRPPIERQVCGLGRRRSCHGVLAVRG